MDKRQLRQSAIADFMQSLEHLDELLGDTAEASVLDDTAQTESSKTQSSPHQPSRSASASSKSPALINPGADASPHTEE